MTGKVIPLYPGPEPLREEFVALAALLRNVEDPLIHDLVLMLRTVGTDLVFLRELLGECLNTLELTTRQRTATHRIIAAIDAASSLLSSHDAPPA